MEYLYQILIIAIGLILIYLTSYVKKRADNIATKKDIEEITEKIETVKAKLQIDTKGAIDFKTDQRQALLEFYDAFVYWYDVVLDLANSNLDQDHLEEIKNYDNKIDDAYSKLIIKERRLDLYLSSDKELLQLTGDLISTGINIEGFVRDFLVNAYFEYEELNEYYSHLDSGNDINKQAMNEIHTRIISLEAELANKEDIVRKEVDFKLTTFVTLTQKYIRIDV